MALQTITESVYVELCHKIGTPTQVEIRRDVVDVRAFLLLKAQRIDMSVMCSGSYREGFRFKDSDIDVMVWPNNHRVFWDFSQAILCNTNRFYVTVQRVHLDSLYFGYQWRKQTVMYYHPVSKLMELFIFLVLCTDQIHAL